MPTSRSTPRAVSTSKAARPSRSVVDSRSAPRSHPAVDYKSTLRFSFGAGEAGQWKGQGLVLGIGEGQKLEGAAADIDRAAGGLIAQLLRAGELDEKAGSTLLLYRVAGCAAERVLLLRLGKSVADFRRAARSAATASNPLGAEWGWAVFDALPKGVAVPTAIEIVATAVLEAGYRYIATREVKKPARPALKKCVLLLDARANAAQEHALAAGIALGEAINGCRELGNLPPNLCTPTFLASQAQSFRTLGLKVDTLGPAEIEKLGMHAFLGVARGSVQPPRMITLRHDGGKKGAPPVVLVGKGITFDSGGISLKPGEAMDEMKYDMLGAASVISTLYAVRALKLPINVVGLVVTCENLPAGNAQKPGDIVTTLSGLTVEVLNTDAEGRLILCDALAYAERLKPAVLIDVATLTGACVVALGHVASGLYANEEKLAQHLLAASEASGDAAWRMPLREEYHEQLKSNFADLANIGGRAGGSITAACFLSRFVPEGVSWAHLDIAGTGWKSGAQKGATGRPVPLLLQYLRGLCNG